MRRLLQVSSVIKDSGPQGQDLSGGYFDAGGARAAWALFLTQLLNRLWEAGAAAVAGACESP